MEEVLAVLNRGGCAVYPTSTQPALGCIPESSALDQLYSLKGRDRSQPVSLGVANLGQAREIAFLPSEVEDMLDFFPRGSITVVLDARTILDMRLGGKRVAIRVVSHDVARELIEEIGPLTATSANLSGSTPHLDTSLAAQSLSTSNIKVPHVRGVCGGNIPSTLISWQSSTGSPDATGTKVLREGLVKEKEVFDWSKNLI
tara:strand:- start:11202 stop:11804 length:603 start_codon:yes stop_codon:yes gene_type:complete